MLGEKCPYLSFSRPYSVRMRENMDQKNPNKDTLHALKCRVT